MSQVVVNYAVRYLSQRGLLQDEFDRFISLDLARGVNKPGWLVLDLPVAALDFRRIRPDERIEIRRQVDDKAFYTEMQTQWLIRKWRQTQSEDGEEILRLAGPAALHLIGRRIAAYDAGTTYTNKSGAAETIMKAIVDENFVSATDADRNIAAWLAVQANGGAGPTVSKGFSRRNILEVLQEISDLSLALGSPIFFDVTPTGTTFQFRTYAGQRGTDRGRSSSRKAVISPNFGNLVDTYVEMDHSEEITHAYAAGTGLEDERAVQPYGDDTRIAVSPFNRIEALVESFVAGTDTTRLLNEAKTAVYEGRPRIITPGKIVQTDDFRYGVEFGFGDRLVRDLGGYASEVLVDNVRISVRGGEETINTEYREV